MHPADVSVTLKIDDVNFLSTETLNGVLRDITKRIRELQIYEMGVACNTLSAEDKSSRDFLDVRVKEYFASRIRAQEISATRVKEIRKGSLTVTIIVTAAGLWIVNKIFGPLVVEATKDSKAYKKWKGRLTNIFDKEIFPGRLKNAHRIMSKKETLGPLEKTKITIDKEKNAIIVELDLKSDKKHEITPLASELESPSK